MNYLLAMAIAATKRVAGWVIIIPAAISTLISLFGFLYSVSKVIKTPDESHELDLILRDFGRVFFEMIQTNTPFLNYFWHKSPVPSLGTGLSSNNVSFLIIYFLIFVGLALIASGKQLSCKVRNIKQTIKSVIIVEEARGEQPVNYLDILNKAKVPHDTILLQFYRLYFLPIIIATVAYFACSYIQKLGFSLT